VEYRTRVPPLIAVFEVIPSTALEAAIWGSGIVTLFPFAFALGDVGFPREFTTGYKFMANSSDTQVLLADMLDKERSFYVADWDSAIFTAESIQHLTSGVLNIERITGQ